MMALSASIWYILGLITQVAAVAGSVIGVLVLIKAYVALDIYIKKNR